MTWWLFDLLLLILILVLISLVVLHNRRDKKAAVEEKEELESQIFVLSEQLSHYHALTKQQQIELADIKNNQAEVRLNLQSLIESLKVIQPLSEQVEYLTNQLQLVQSESKEQQMYGRAKKMIEMGADIDELMFECEVPRAEAELLFSMYKK